MRLSSVFVAMLACGITTGAQASVTGYGSVSAIYSLAGGQVLFNLSGSRSATPACHTIPSRWAFDGTTVAGQQKLAILLTAHATSKQIEVVGTDTCDIWLDTESVNYLLTAD